MTRIYTYDAGKGRAEWQRALMELTEGWDSGELPRFQPWVESGQPHRSSSYRSVLEANLSLMLRASRAIETLRVTPDSLATERLCRRLLASVEDETGLPSITALVTGDSLTTTFGSGAPLSQQQVTEAAEAWRAIYRIARDVVERSICVQHYAFAHHPPPLETSPCGVIGFAAPRIPRAPGRPVYSPVPSSFGVAA